MTSVKTAEGAAGTPAQRGFVISQVHRIVSGAIDPLTTDANRSGIRLFATLNAGSDA